MIKHHWIPLANMNKWNEMLALNHCHQLAHTYDYNQAIQSVTGEDIYLYAATSDNFSCVCPYAIRQKSHDDPADIHTPYGFSGLAIDGVYPGFHDLRKKYLADKGYICGYMLQHPCLSIKSDELPVGLLPGKSGFTINLLEDYETIISKFSSDHRQRYRRWLKDGFEVSWDESKNQIERFIDLYERGLDARGASSVYDFGKIAWSKLIKHPSAYLFFVEEDGIATAAALFFSYNRFVDYYMTATTPGGKKHTRGLICHAIQFFKSRGDHVLFLGCGIHENDALHNYKLRFGGVSSSTYSVREIYNQEMYDIMCMKYVSNAAPITGFFPKYWAS